MSIASNTPQGESVQAQYWDLVDQFETSFTAFIDFEYTAESILKTVTWLRRNFGFYCGVNASRRLFINDWTAEVSGTTVFTTGRWRAFFTWDDVTLTAWAMPEGGSIVQEISSSGVFNPRLVSEQQPGVGFGVNPNIFPNGDMERINDAAVWNIEIDAIHRFGLLEAGLSPRMIVPEAQVLKAPTFPGIGDSTGESMTPSPCTLKATLTGAPVENMRVLKDPDTHAPLLVSDGAVDHYWGIGNDGTEDDLELYKSTDLVAWTFVEDITSAIGEGMANLGACDFVRDSGATRQYQAIYWGEIAGNNDVYIISTASLSSTVWTNETNNPIFRKTDIIPLPLGSNGPEDFTVTLDDAGDWVSLFEHNSAADNGVGIAKNTAVRLADAFTYEGLFADGIFVADWLRNPGTELWANPVVIKLDGLYYCFYEHRTTNEGNNTLHAVSSDPGDPGSWELLGGAVAPETIDGPLSSQLFPNGSYIDPVSGKIVLVLQTNQNLEYQGLDALFVPGETRPFWGMQIAYGTVAIPPVTGNFSPNFISTYGYN